MNLTEKEFWKSVYICQSYDQKSSVLLFEAHCIYKVAQKYPVNGKCESKRYRNALPLTSPDVEQLPVLYHGTW